METAKLGQILIFTGAGMGKNSTALGLAIRAVGQDKKVMILYFDKNENSYTERYVLNKLEGDVDYQIVGLELTDSATGQKRSDFGKKDFELAKKGLLAAQKIASQGKYDMLILDEINEVLTRGLLSVQDLIDFLKAKPAYLDLILTGTNCPNEVKRRADSVVVLSNF